MDFIFLSQINYFAVLVSSIIFFMIGAVWFAPSFLGTIWRKELELHNVVIQQPTSTMLMTKMLLTFAANIVASFAMAWLVTMTGSNNVVSGLILGAIVTIGFAATTLGSTFIWENRSVKLFLLDIGYPALGIITIALLLSVLH